MLKLEQLTEVVSLREISKIERRNTTEFREEVYRTLEETKSSLRLDC